MEMMVAMTLLVVIVMGLTMMFLQTQKAFKSGLRQVDVLESGRSVMSLIADDLAAMVDAGRYSDRGSNVWNLTFQEAGYPRLRQDENGVGFRTNYIYDLFSLSRVGSQWIGTGYAVSNLSANGIASVGTLYRYTHTINSVAGLTDNVMYQDYYNSLQNAKNYPFTNTFTRVADGVVHFRIRAYYGDTLVLTNDAVFPCNYTTYTPVTNYIARAGIPNTVEVELGILEPETYEQARSMPSNAALTFLQGRASKVHIFRQQIPIRAASR